MGYRSEGTMVVAFESLADMKEVLAVYRLDPRVQEHNPFTSRKYDADTTGCWTFHTWNTNTREEPIIWYLMRLDFCDWKWYPEFEDVQAFEHIAEVCKHFANERENFTYAYKFVRGGEDGEDSEDDCYGSNTELSQMMCEHLNEVLSISQVWAMNDHLCEDTTRQDPSSLGLGNINPSDVTRKTKENDNVNI